VVDRVDLRWVSEAPVDRVSQHGPVFPAAFEQLVDDLQVFVRAVIALVVTRKPAEPKVGARVA